MKREVDRDWQVLAGFAALVAAVWLLSFLPLIHAPGDRARAARIVPRPATRAVDPGPVEATLYRLADAHHRTSLIVDTRRAEYDPKQWARSCDASERAACTRIASFFVHFLGAPVLGMRLWVEACGSGIDAACTRAAEQFARDALPSFDLRLAHRLFMLGCSATAVDPSGCVYAADPDRIFGRLLPGARPREQACAAGGDRRPAGASDRVRGAGASRARRRRRRRRTDRRTETNAPAKARARCPSRASEGGVAPVSERRVSLVSVRSLV